MGHYHWLPLPVWHYAFHSFCLVTGFWGPGCAGSGHHHHGLLSRWLKLQHHLLLVGRRHGPQVRPWAGSLLFFLFPFMLKSRLLWAFFSWWFLPVKKGTFFFPYYHQVLLLEDHYVYSMITICFSCVCKLNRIFSCFLDPRTLLSYFKEDFLVV